VKTGEMAFSVKQYAVAIDLLEEEYLEVNNSSDKHRKAYLLAQSYDFLQDHPNALKWYDLADQLQTSDKSSIDLAYALKKNERFEDAANLFATIYKKTKINKYRSEAEICSEAIKKMKNIDQYDIEPFSINTEYSEYSPAFFENDFIVFSSDREGSTGNDTYQTTGNNFSDLFVINKRGRQVHNFDAVINSDANEGTVCFNKTFDEIFFSRCVSKERDGQYCKLYYSKRANGYWLEPEALMFFDDKTNFFHPALIENDSVLVFSAAPNGSKTYDLYYSERVENGWTEAVLMPTTINSLGNEKFPTSYKDTLYFSSDGHLGYGGLDIFKSYLVNGKWTKPQNMGLPLNSGADDFGLVIDNSFKPNANLLLEGFLSSSRNFANNDDIFFFSIYPKVETEDEYEEDEPTEDIAPLYSIYLAGRVVENIYKKGDPNLAIIGKNAIDDAYVSFSTRDSSFNLTTDESGRFLLELSTSGSHDILSKRLGFLTKEEKLFVASGSQITSDTTINIEIAMDRIVYDSEITIPNIYYDYDKANIRKDAKPSLNSLVSLLKLNPQLNIELGSHTDCRGEVDYNKDLSQRRAESVVEYLTENGIDGQRLSPMGYGESNLALNCDCDNCTENQHQVNRRTTFKILK
jgi:outer membrane protein OmpA-like peptidoglycan-associated protein